MSSSRSFSAPSPSAFSGSIFPDWTLQLFKWAGTIRESLISGTWPARYEVVLRALVDERQIVYMGFVLATRIIVGVLIMLVYKLFGRKTKRNFRYRRSRRHHS